MAEQQEKGLNLLALDGGGIRGLSTLYILKTIMISIQDERKLPKEPLPCEVFDLIGGTSTGGLIALMLGRLRMSMDDAIQAYAKLSKKVFSQTKNGLAPDGRYKASNLEDAVKTILQEYGADTKTGIVDSRSGDGVCPTFVCTVLADNMKAQQPLLIRTYRAPRQLPLPCTIIEAARATTAAPTFFKRAVITVDGITQTYMDGGLVQNNPCDVVLREANLMFPERQIACVLSIGTGQLLVNKITEPNFIKRLIPIDVAKALAKIATATENTHEDLQRRFKSRPNLYFRFNVDQGLQDVTLDEWNKMGAVKGHTQMYLGSEAVKARLEEAVKVMVEQRATLGVSEAIGKIAAAVKLHRKAKRKHCPPPSHVFTGRTDILSTMTDHFCSDSTNNQLMFVLYGMGGSGKSEIMRRFVADSQAQADDRPRRFSEVLYVDASLKATLDVDLAGIALDKKIGEKGQDTIDWLVRTREPWLLVLDNADDATLDLEPFIPQCLHGNIIITTRNEQLCFYHRSCKISRMSGADAKALFVRRSGIANPEDINTSKLVTELVEALDFLALGIIQAAAYLQVNKTYSLERYLTLLHSDLRNLLERPRGINHPDNYKQTVYSTWNISLEQLNRTHPEAVMFLFICSFLHHKNISESMFINAAINSPDCMPDTPALSDSTISWVQDFLRPFVEPSAEMSDAFHSMTASLCSYSLVEYTPEHNISFHRLVHDWSRHQALTTEKHPIYTALILHLSCSGFCDLNTPEALSYTRMHLPHMQELLRLFELLDSGLNAEITARFNLIYLHHGWLSDAEKVGMQAMETSKRVLGEEHPSTLTRTANLASTYRNQGRWTEAEGLEVAVMDMSKRVLGEDHPSTLARMANLASTYWNQGRWTEAEELQVAVMESSKQVLGEDHPDMLTSMANLASTYRNQGRWTEAEGLQVAVMETSKRVLGEEHPSTLTRMANLASTYRNQGRLTEAEELQVKVIETSKRVLGEEHPSTLTSMANLSSTYSNQGRWTEAEGLKVKVMEMSKRVLGEEHPSTLTRMANLASTYLNQGRWTEAEGLQVAVMKSSKRVLGEEHPDTLTSMANLSSTYSNQGRWTEAEGLQVAVMETSKRVLCEEHPSTLRRIANLASTYWNQGRWTEAEELQVAVMESSKRVLGEEHPDTLTRMANLASTYWNQGRWTEAEGLQVAVMETSKRVLGEDHPHTLKGIANLASTYLNQGRWTEAEGLQVAVMESSKQVLGEDHPDMLTSMANLASTYRNQGRWTEAEGLQVAVMETSKRVLGEEHPSTLTRMANLASTYWNQGRLTEAEELQVKVMEMSKRVLGEDHPHMLTMMANLASTYRSQGRWTEAEELQVEVIDTSKRVLGKEHPDTLTMMANLASTYWNQGRLTEAEKLQVAVMETSKRVLGEEHPDTLTRMANLAFTYKSHGRWTEAEGLFVTVVEKRKRVLGDEHPDTQTSIENLTAMQRKHGHETDSSELLSQSRPEGSSG